MPLAATADKHALAGRRIAQQAGAPGEGAEQKQPDGARERYRRAGKRRAGISRSRKASTSSESARRIDAVAHRRHPASMPRSAWPQYPAAAQTCSARYKPEKRRAAKANSQRGPNRNGSTIQSGERIFGQDIAVPDQAKMNQVRTPAARSAGAPAARCGAGFRKPLELDGKARRRTAARTAQTPSGRPPASGWFPRRGRAARPDALWKRNCSKIETRNIRRDVDRHHAEQRDAAQHVDGVDPLGRVYRPRGCRSAIASHGCIDFRFEAPAEMLRRLTTAACPANAGLRS